MSIRFIAVRNKKNKNLYYRSRAKGQTNGGWIEGMSYASMYTNMIGPSKIIKLVGEEHCEIVSIEAHLREGEMRKVFIIRNKVTGLYFANKKMRSRKELYTDNWSHIGIWADKKVAYHMPGLYAKFKQTQIDPKELEIIEINVFVPSLVTGVNEDDSESEK